MSVNLRVMTGSCELECTYKVCGHESRRVLDSML